MFQLNNQAINPVPQSLVQSELLAAASQSQSQSILRIEIMFEPMFKPTPYLSKAGKNAREVKGMLPPTIQEKARRREGDVAG